MDDTVIFAGRLRRAKAAKYAEDIEKGLHGIGLKREFDDRDVVEVVLIPGISHGFLQFCGCFPEGWKYIYRCGRWIEHIFAQAEAHPSSSNLNTPMTPHPQHGFQEHHRRRRSQSSGEEDQGLEMSMIRKDSKGKGKEGGRGRGRGRGMQKNKSMVSLASEDDLLGRRMLGLAGPLTRVVGDDDD